MSGAVQELVDLFEIGKSRRTEHNSECSGDVGIVGEGGLEV